ncbi:MAG: hypothetical protein HZA36_03305 [Parcubacteria group bacterium]|nr:hypothetical protein [Parcubacteria group bacterium]
MATLKQKLVARYVVENGGNVSRAMVQAGYSWNTAHTPQKLTESKGWHELMDMCLSDDLLLEKHRELLMLRNTTGMDAQAVVKGLDMAYRLKGKYTQRRSVGWG